MCVCYFFLSNGGFQKKIIDNENDNYYTSASFRSQTVNALLD